jgi:transcriptional regulator with PAS, ATPase and Fis domain
MTYICNFCNKEISTKFNLSKHITTCKRKDEVLQKEKYEKEINSLKEKINSLKELHEKEIQSLNDQLKEFKSQIFEIAKQPKTTNNNQKINIINQLAVYDLTEESVRSIVNEHFTEEVFK